MITTHLLGKAKWSLIAGSLLLCLTNTVHADALDEKTRIDLQITLKDYVEEQSSSGSYHFFDTEKGTMLSLSLKKLHPVIFEREGSYLMCADFIDKEGQEFLIDYIVVATDSGYAVTQQIKGRRSYLKTLFDRVF